MSACTATLIAHLAEFESRELHLAIGYSSLFAYCQEALHYSEEESYRLGESQYPPAPGPAPAACQL